MLVSLFSDSVCTAPLQNSVPTKLTNAATSCNSIAGAGGEGFPMQHVTCTKGAMPFPAQAAPESSVITTNFWTGSASCAGIPTEIDTIPTTFGGVCVDLGSNRSSTALCAPGGLLLSYNFYRCHSCACEGEPLPWPISSGCHASPLGNSLTIGCHSAMPSSGPSPGRATDDTPKATSTQAALIAPLALASVSLCAALGYFLHARWRTMQTAQDKVHLASASDAGDADSAVLMQAVPHVSASEETTT